MTVLSLKDGRQSIATLALDSQRTAARSTETIKLLVYSHDTFGLGNIRRMIAICEYLKAHVPGLSVLVLTGSSMIHGFRLIDGIDYVKLPCIKRDLTGSIGVNYLNLNKESTLRLREELIFSTVTTFKPDVFIVDKKPGGIGGELEESVKALKSESPDTSVVLLLRDILDDASVTVDQWSRQHNYELIDNYYDSVLVAGLPELYDVREEYQFPMSLRAKVNFCGYLRREAGAADRDAVRREFNVTPNDRLVVVTTGGGEDGFSLLSTYLQGLINHWSHTSWRSVIITGPDLAEPHQLEVRRLVDRCPHTQAIEFTDQMMKYLQGADLVVSMGGYNTICEILSLRKRAIIVPRVQPVQEQRIRAERMARLGLFKTIHPVEMTQDSLIAAVMEELEAIQSCPLAPASLALDALPRICSIILDLVRRKTTDLHSVPALIGR
jgi:predicted glycosyltransferase